MINFHEVLSRVIRVIQYEPNWLVLAIAYYFQLTYIAIWSLKNYNSKNIRCITDKKSYSFFFIA